jgi:hypothetical protein
MHTRFPAGIMVAYSVDAGTADAALELREIRSVSHDSFESDRA